MLVVIKLFESGARKINSVLNSWLDIGTPNGARGSDLGDIDALCVCNSSAKYYAFTNDERGWRT
jgi:hypothetical protein